MLNTSGALGPEGRKVTSFSAAGGEIFFTQSAPLAPQAEKILNTIGALGPEGQSALLQRRRRRNL